MTINLHLPGKPEMLRPTITVIGVGGAGGNAVNNMINSSLEGVNFVVANTDAQALENAMTERRIQLGSDLTRGLGAGASPEIGRAAAEEAIEEISGYVEGSNMVFITAGMGGGTGTGAAPVVARLAKERGILTVGVVTKPFQFEGAHRMRLAEQGLRELQQYVDTLIVIPNQNLFRIANEKTTFADAFRLADEVLHSGVRGVTDLMIMPGLINLDFADIRTVMREMGKAMMGTGEAEGPKRAIEAAEAAISNPLLDDVSMKGARGVLINITGGNDLTLFEVDEATSRIREEVDPDANIIFGATFNPMLEGKLRVSVVATGIDLGSAAEPKPHASSEQNRFYGGKVGFNGRPAEAVKVAPVAITAKTNDFALKETVQAAPAHQQNSEKTSVLKDNTGGLRASFNRTIAPAPKAMEVSEPSHDYKAYEPPHHTAQADSYQTNAQQADAYHASSTHREPSFVTPQPAQPAQRNFFSPQESPAFNKTSAAKQAPREQQDANQHRDEPSPQGSSVSFFQRVAGVGRVLASKGEGSAERTMQVVEKARIEATEQSSKTASEDAYLEIPAFLRRQAN